jgi:small ligand-binding sensory domain FIST
LGAGDFLIRQVIGVSVKDGGLVIGDKVKPGQRFRFHVRDRESAMTEAESLFSGQTQTPSIPTPKLLMISHHLVIISLNPHSSTLSPETTSLNRL